MLLQTTMNTGGTRDAGALPVLELLAPSGCRARTARSAAAAGVESGSSSPTCRAPFFGIRLADVLPQIAKDRRVGVDRVVGHRHARQLDDAAFDRVHQREIGDDPGEQRAFLVAGAAQEEGRGGEVVDGAQPDLALQRLDAGDPQARRLVVLLRLLLLLALEARLLLGVGPLAVAMMRLVVDRRRRSSSEAARRRRASASRLRFPR